MTFAVSHFRSRVLFDSVSSYTGRHQWFEVYSYNCINCDPVKGSPLSFPDADAPNWVESCPQNINSSPTSHQLSIFHSVGGVVSHITISLKESLLAKGSEPRTNKHDKKITTTDQHSTKIPEVYHTPTIRASST